MGSARPLLIRRYTAWVLLLFQSALSLEFDFRYDPEAHLTAVINLSYVDPETGLLTEENLQTGQLLPGRGSSDEVSGVVVHVTSNEHTSHEACDRLDNDTLPEEPFIALVRHGSCRDQVKLRHVAEGRAAAAILYHDHHTNRFIGSERRANPIIFAVINEKKGEWLANLVDNGTRVMMIIGVSSEDLESFQVNHFSRTSILFISITLMILMVILFAWLLSYNIQRFRYFRAKEILSRHICSAAKKALDKIPVKIVKTDNSGHDENYDCCAVCIESFQRGELIRTLPCSHCFHKICIDPWLLEQRCCPMCKLDILMHFGLVYSGSEESVLDIEDDGYQRPRAASLVEHEIVPNQRRVSGARVSVSLDPGGLVEQQHEGASDQRRRSSARVVVSLDPESLVAEREISSPNRRRLSGTRVVVSLDPSEQHDVVAENQRRRSSPRVAFSLDPAVSPAGQADTTEPSTAVAVEKVAGKTDDPTDVVDRESTEEGCMQKNSSSFSTAQERQESTSLKHDVIIKTEYEDFEICDVSFEN